MKKVFLIQFSAITILFSVLLFSATNGHAQDVVPGKNEVWANWNNYNYKRKLSEKYWLSMDMGIHYQTMVNSNVSNLYPNHFLAPSESRYFSTSAFFALERRRAYNEKLFVFIGPGIGINLSESHNEQKNNDANVISSHFQRTIAPNVGFSLGVAYNFNQWFFVGIQMRPAVFLRIHENEYISNPGTSNRVISNWSTTEIGFSMLNPRFQLGFRF